MADRLRIAFVSPRFPVAATVGGAETLLRALAEHALRLGHDVAFLTTCAADHFTWRNEHPEGTRTFGDLPVTFFPVDDDRDPEAFLRAQRTIDSGRPVDRTVEAQWLANSVNSRALCRHLEQESHRLDKVIAGPYLFGLTCAAARVAPAKTLLLPCLHDEVFAYLACIRELFRSVAGFVFNSEPERALAAALYDLPEDTGHVVGMGIDPFVVPSAPPSSLRDIPSPYLVYAGRREPMKGTPLLLDYFDAFLRRTRDPLSLVLMGSGPVDVPESCRRAVFDLGFVSEEEKHAVMANALAFVHPSINESLGIVLLEAWMAGAPVLVHAESKVLRDQCVRSNGGLWFRTYGEFEEEVGLLRCNARVRRALADAGRAYVTTTYSWPSVEERFEEALRG